MRPAAVGQGLMRYFPPKVIEALRTPDIMLTDGNDGSDGGGGIVPNRRRWYHQQLVNIKNHQKSSGSLRTSVRHKSS